MTADTMRTWKVGDVKVTRIVEVNAHTDPLSVLLKEGTPELMKKYAWLFPHFATPEGDMKISFQCFVVKTGKRRVMIDTCIGNDRRRPYPVFTNMQTSFLKDLARAGCPAESIDTVLCTHLHFDHVGWNTQLVNGKWVPTFPNARYLFSRKEWNHWKKHPRDGSVEAQHLEDSIQPVLDAGLAEFVATDYRICRELRLEPSHGHSPGHVHVRISSRGERAVITGDLMHHPIQFAVPDMRTNFCMDVDKAIRTRKAFIRKYQDRKVLVIGTHFCDPTAGWIERDRTNWRFSIK